MCPVELCLRRSFASVQETCNDSHAIHSPKRSSRLLHVAAEVVATEVVATATQGTVGILLDARRFVTGGPDVLLTRESGKNAALEATLRSHGVGTFEVPLVETVAGPDR